MTSNAPPARHAEAGADGDLVAVVAGQVDADHGGPLGRLPEDRRPGGVARAVVDQDDLVVAADPTASQARGHALDKGRPSPAASL